LDDVELDLVTFFERFVAFQLDGAVMDEDIRSAFPSQKAEAFCVVEPFDLTFVLSHSSLLAPDVANCRGVGVERDPLSIERDCSVQVVVLPLRYVLS
jgi:hypothetical protein